MVTGMFYVFNALTLVGLVALCKCPLPIRYISSCNRVIRKVTNILRTKPNIDLCFPDYCPLASLEQDYWKLGEQQWDIRVTTLMFRPPFLGGWSSITWYHMLEPRRNDHGRPWPIMNYHGPKPWCHLTKHGQKPRTDMVVHGQPW